MRRSRAVRAPATLRPLLRAPGYPLAAIAAFAAGGLLGAFTFALLFPASLRPFSLARRIQVDPLRASDWGLRWSADSLQPEHFQRESLESLLLLLGIIALLALGVAALNGAILVLTRATARRQELSIRAAVGATRRHFAAHLCAEAGLLGLAGGIIAAMLGSVLTHTLEHGWPAGLRPLDGDLGIALPALALPLLLTILLAALAAALLWRPTALAGELTTGGRATVGRHEGELRNALAIMQFAALFVLLTAAGLLIRNSVPLLEQKTLGFDPRDTLTLDVALPPGTRSAADRAAALGELQEGMRRLPGATAAGVGSHGVWFALATTDRVLVDCGACVIGNMGVPFQGAEVGHHVVSPGFFRTLGVPLLAGREFVASDTIGAPPVAVVSAAFARANFERGIAVGRVVRIGGWQGEWYRVVGVVGSINPRGLGAGRDPRKVVYLSMLQHPPTSVSIAIRGTLASAIVVRGVRSALPGASVAGPPVPLERTIADFAAPLRWAGMLLALLAAVALALALQGVYSVLGQAVLRRRREIGVRVALGARPMQVLALISRQSLRLALRGAAFGLLGALAAARALQLLFRDVRLADPVLWAVLLALLAATALAGAMVPAWRAGRVDPAEAFGAE